MSDNRTPEERFWNYVVKTDTCWNWVGYTAIPSNFKRHWKLRPYGRIRVYGKTVLAHRLSYELFKGKIPKGLEIDHLCRNTICVNPDHLEAVSSKINRERGNGISQINKRKTHCKFGHEFTPENTRWANKGSWRICRICRRCYSREEKARKRALKM